MSHHPLSGIGLEIANFKCFGEPAGGFAEFKPINIIIGRNNTGKSALIDVIDLCISRGKSFDPAKHARPAAPLTAKVKQKLDEPSLRRIFPQGTTRGFIGGDHWVYGKQFVGQVIERSFGPGWDCRLSIGPDFQLSPDGRAEYNKRLADMVVWPFEGLRLIRIAAERDVQPEQRLNERKLHPNGAGTTNVIRAFINSVDLPREEVEHGLLADLNTVYRGDCEFSEIICQEDANQNWEIYLREDKKGDIRLSQSGSSLKSIFIILAVLRLLPRIEKIAWEKVILAIEEPENNLHPSLLRRLLNFLADQRSNKHFTLVITTHSPIGIDWSARRSDSQIIHVQHDGRSARCQTAIEYRQSRDIIEDLDIRASDILQANCVIWVEGPSDRIYVRRWLDLVSDRQLIEGIHYTIMFYGGRLLSHLDALPPGDSQSSISLLAINRNAAVIIDSDRRGNSTGRKPPSRLNATKQRIKRELEAINGFVWITEGREIENYTPIEVYARVVGQPVPEVDPYTEIISLPLLKKFKEDKVQIAHAIAAQTKKSDLETHLDVWPKLNELRQRIEQWNGSS